MVLVQKWPFFQLFLLGNIGQENFFYDIPKQKIVFLGFKKKKFKKSKKIYVFPKGLTHGFGIKWPFFELLFLHKTGQENVFYDIVERKNDFFRL